MIKNKLQLRKIIIKVIRKDSILWVFQLFGEANVMMVKEYPRMSVLVIKESISQESYVLISIVSLARRSLHDRCSRGGRRSRGMCDLTARKFTLPTMLDIVICHS